MSALGLAVLLLPSLLLGCEVVGPLDPMSAGAGGSEGKPSSDAATETLDGPAHESNTQARPAPERMSSDTGNRASSACSGDACAAHDTCPSGACTPGGTCIPGVGGYSCACEPGYSGTGTTRCTQTDDCPPGACAPGGICVDGLDDYKCICDVGYAGSNTKQCSNVDDCPADACENGTCVDAVNDYSCSCNAPFIGTGTKSCVENWECSENSPGVCVCLQSQNIGDNCARPQSPCCFAYLTDAPDDQDNCQCWPPDTNSCRRFRDTMSDGQVAYVEVSACPPPTRP